MRQSRDLRILLGGQLVSLLGNQLTLVAIPYQVYELTHSSLDVGLVSLAQLIPLLVCSLYGGTVIDSTDRRRLLIRVEIVLALCSIGLAFNTDLGPRLWPLFVLPAIAAGLTGFDNPTRNAIVPRLVGAEHISTASAMVQVLNQVGIVVGPQPPSEHATRPGLRAVAEGFRYVRQRQGIQGAYLIDINAMVFGMPRALFPAMAITVFHGGATAVGFLYAAPAWGR